MGVIIFIGTYFGDYLDKKYNTDSIYTISFSLGSVFLSIYYVIKEIIKHNE